MSTFRHRWGIVLDDKSYEVTTRYADYTSAEGMLAREHKQLADSPMGMQGRVMFVAFSRAFPDHPVANNWPKFHETLDDMTDLEPSEEQPLDPTRPAASENWP